MQKSPSLHVCDPQNRLMAIVSTPYTSLQSLGLIIPPENLFGSDTMRWTRYFQQFLQCFTFKTFLNLHFFKGICLEYTIKNVRKLEKSTPAYVWWHRNRFTHRTITSFDSADTLGPKQVSQSHQRHQGAHKIIFAHSKLKHDVFLKAFFDAKHATFHHFWRKFLKNLKNWLPMDVYARQNLLRRRMITPNTLLDSLWLAQHFTNLSRGQTMR